MTDVRNGVFGICNIVMNAGNNGVGVRVVIPNVGVGCMSVDPEFGLGESYRWSYRNDRTYLKDTKNPL